jgi:hypothetical protein
MPEGFFQVRLLYKRAAKARPAAPSMKGAAVCMAPESPDEVPDSELSPGPEPVEEAAAREAVEAAEPPAEMADWLTSESSWILSQSIVTLQLFQSWKLTRGGCGCLAEEAGDSRTAGRCTGVGCGGNTRVCAVCGHGHHARATREVVTGGGSNL